MIAEQVDLKMEHRVHAGVGLTIKAHANKIIVREIRLAVVIVVIILPKVRVP